jgi:hypothetical protein
MNHAAKQLFSAPFMGWNAGRPSDRGAAQLLRQPAPSAKREGCQPDSPPGVRLAAREAAPA